MSPADRLRKIAQLLWRVVERDLSADEPPQPKPAAISQEELTEIWEIARPFE